MGYASHLPQCASHPPHHLLIDQRESPNSATSSDQAMIGASAAPMRSRCAGVIMPFSKLLKRGSCTPDTMYCQRYASSTVVLPASTSIAAMERPPTSMKYC